jgi:ribosomal protein S18 acetylase RimI-like enzyme
MEEVHPVTSAMSGSVTAMGEVEGLLIRRAHSDDAAELGLLMWSIVDEGRHTAASPKEALAAALRVMSDVSESSRLCSDSETTEAGASEKLIDLVAVAGPEIVGLAQYERCEGTQTERLGSVHVFIRARWRRRGIGRRLTAELVSHAAAANCERLRLSVLSTNAPARSLYEKMDFRSTARGAHVVEFEDGTSAYEIIMERALR